MGIFPLNTKGVADVKVSAETGRYNLGSTV